jgi:5-amino-6-(5-phospho-D-ribitylamino)uracil phosphatase
MDIKMIVTDLDQTLLQTDKTLSPYSQEVFKKCKEQGIHVAIATARSEQQAKRYIDLLKPDIVISNGGSLVKYRGEIIYKCMLSIEISNQIITECALNSKCGDIAVQTETAYYSNGINFNTYGADFSHAQFNDYTIPLNCMTHKISVEIFDKIYANELALKYSNCNFIGFSGESWYRFAHEAATKLKAIIKISEYFNIDLKQIIAFGDDYNDVEMLKECYGVAVSNANKEAKTVAKYITKSNDDDGVAWYIDRNILEYLYTSES